MCTTEEVCGDTTSTVAATSAVAADISAAAGRSIAADTESLPAVHLLSALAILPPAVCLLVVQPQAAPVLPWNSV